MKKKMMTVTAADWGRSLQVELEQSAVDAV